MTMDSDVDEAALCDALTRDRLERPAFFLATNPEALNDNELLDSVYRPPTENAEASSSTNEEATSKKGAQRERDIMFQCLSWEDYSCAA